MFHQPVHAPASTDGALNEGQRQDGQCHADAGGSGSIGRKGGGSLAGGVLTGEETTGAGLKPGGV